MWLRAAARSSPASTATSPGCRSRRPSTTSTSATRIQRWAACPFDYLLTEVLGVEPVENPEEALQISAVGLGQPRPRGTRTVHPRGARGPRRDAEPGRSVVGRRSGAHDRDRRRRVCRVRGARRHRPARLLASRTGADPARPATVPHRGRPQPAREAHAADRGRAGVRDSHGDGRRGADRVARRPELALPRQGRPHRRRRATAASTSSTTRPAGTGTTRGSPRRTPTSAGCACSSPVYGVAARCINDSPMPRARRVLVRVVQGRLQAHRLRGHGRRSSRTCRRDARD